MAIANREVGNSMLAYARLSIWILTLFGQLFHSMLTSTGQIEAITVH